MEKKKFELKEKQFCTFKNKKKEKYTHADFTGDALKGAVEYWVNMWAKNTKSGDIYYSFSLREKGGITQKHQESLVKSDLPF